MLFHTFKVNEDLQALFKNENISLLAANSFVDNPDNVIKDLKARYIEYNSACCKYLYNKPAHRRANICKNFSGSLAPGTDFGLHCLTWSKTTLDLHPRHINIWKHKKKQT